MIDKHILKNEMNSLRLQGLSYRKIAKLYNMTYSTVRRWLDVDAAQKERKYNNRWHLENQTQVRDRKKQYRLNNLQKCKKQESDRRLANLEVCREKDRAKSKKWRNENKGKYLRDKYKNDIQYKLAKNLRGRIRHSLKAGSAERDLGCSIQDLKLRLEILFLPGMTWANYGKWHIDHIRPLSSFDLTDRKQFLQACNFTNLQPLWAKDNLAKGAKYGL